MDNELNRHYRDIEVKVDRDAFCEWAIPRIVQFNREHPDESPSVDRIDPDGHYEFTNMRIITWKDNALRSRYFLHMIGVSNDDDESDNLNAICRAVRVISHEVGLSKDKVLAHLTSGQDWNGTRVLSCARQGIPR